LFRWCCLHLLTMEQVPPQALPAQAVQMVSKTWARDTHNLFDFESDQHHTQTFTVSKSMECVRRGTKVEILSSCTSLPLGSDPLLRLVQKAGNFWIDNAALPRSSSKKPWCVVRDMPAGGHRLSENDVIKLGRFRFRVHQLVASANDGTQPELRLFDSGSACCPNSTQHKLQENDDDNPLTCRICLTEEDDDDDDPFIAPCACKGTIKHIHLGCLRHWIRDRLNWSDASVGSYFYRALPCELCKAIYPTYVTVGGERTPLVEVPRIQPPFIVLENMERDSGQHARRGLHIISLAEKAVKLGRSHDCQVQIADVSISRCHATIRFDDGHFILEDNNSKFGTLVAMRMPLLLESGNTVSIQTGRTVLSLCLQPDPSAADTQPLLPLAGSNAQDEGGAGPSEEPRLEAAA